MNTPEALQKEALKDMRDEQESSYKFAVKDATQRLMRAEEERRNASRALEKIKNTTVDALWAARLPPWREYRQRVW